MTWALVKDTSGKRTFSRLETCSCRPSTRTSCLLTGTAVPAGRSPLLDHVLGHQVVPQPAPRRVAHPAVGGPGGEGHLPHQLRHHPVRVAGDLARQRVGEGWCVGGGEQRLELLERRGGEAGADVPGVHQPAGVVVHAHQQRAHSPGPPAPPGPPPARAPPPAPAPPPPPPAPPRPPSRRRRPPASGRSSPCASPVRAAPGGRASPA